MPKITSQEYLQNLVGGLISFPEELKIERSVDEMGVLLTVKVSKPDMGKIIGKSGETAKAIRLLMNSFGWGSSEKVSVKILEPNK